MKGIEEWRARNAGDVLALAEQRLEEMNHPKELINRTHPRLLYIVFDHSSWHDAAEMQNMWAGLLISSALSTSWDESNLVFVSMLSQMTATEVNLVNYACRNATKVVSEDGVIMAEPFECPLDQVMRVARTTELFRLDFKLDHLRALGLLPYGLNLHEETNRLFADITPSSLALYMFVRCQGFPGSPASYFT